LELLEKFPTYNFVEGDCFLWSPKYKVIVYNPEIINTDEGRLGLLHEIAHALLDHRIYKYDMELLKMELEAWTEAKRLAAGLNVPINQEHIKRAISSYDDWLTRRATCPDCESFGAQSGRDSYKCFTCGAKWSVNWRKDRRVMRTVTSRYPSIQPA